MAIADRVCSKCGGPMRPGYPLEQTGDTGAFKSCTRWIDGVPRIKQWWLGEYLATPMGPMRFVLGFSCSKCGLIELYAVTEADLRFHAGNQQE